MKIIDACFCATKEGKMKINFPPNIIWKMPTKVGSGVGVGHVVQSEIPGVRRGRLYMCWKWKESRWGMRNSCQRQKRTGVRKNKTFFFLKKKRRKDFAKRLLPKMFWHEGEKFFIFEFFCCWGGLN